MTSSRICYYKILKVPYDATIVDIKTSFRSLAKNLHPDTNGGCPMKTKEFKLVSQAYDTLSNPLSRKQYDRDSGIYIRSSGSRESSASSSFQDQYVKMDKRGNVWGKIYAPRPPSHFQQVFDHELWYDMHYNGGELREALNRGKTRRQMESDATNGFKETKKSFVVQQRKHTVGDNAEHYSRIYARDTVIDRMNMRRAQRGKRPNLMEDEGCVIS